MMVAMILNLQKVEVLQLYLVIQVWHFLKKLYIFCESIFQFRSNKLTIKT